MILRRVTKHVNDQNWFAVGIDFIIVVFGVFIGLQVANWNEGRSNDQLAVSYYERLSADIHATISDLTEQEKAAMKGMVKIDAFTRLLNEPNSSDSELVTATHEMFSQGMNMTGYDTTRATFDDLASTGNLELLADSALRNALIDLHNNFEVESENSLVNSDWILTFEASLIEQFDWMRYDTITAHHFPQKPDDILATEIRAAEDVLRRSAAHHYWYHSVIAKDYQNTIAQAREVLALIDSELEEK